jgi:hypothetical protein
MLKSSHRLEALKSISSKSSTPECTLLLFVCNAFVKRRRSVPCGVLALRPSVMRLATSCGAEQSNGTSVWIVRCAAQKALQEYSKDQEPVVRTYGKGATVRWSHIPDPRTHAFRMAAVNSCGSKNPEPHLRKNQNERTSSQRLDIQKQPRSESYLQSLPRTHPTRSRAASIISAAGGSRSLPSFRNSSVLLYWQSGWL